MLGWAILLQLMIIITIIVTIIVIIIEIFRFIRAALLQCVAKLKGGETILAEDIQDISGHIEKTVIDDWLKVALSGSYEQAQQFVQKMIADGFAANQLLSQLHDAVIIDEQLDDLKKAKIAEKMSICDKRLMDGSSEYLILMDVTCEIIKCGLH